MSDPIVGIDLGTTNSVVAVCDANGVPRVLPDAQGVKVHPSVVSFHPNGSVVVGVEGKQRRIIDPRNTVYSAKRLIGRPFRSREIQAAQVRMPYLLKEGQNQQPVIITRGGEFAVPEISAIVLDHVRNLAANALGEEVTRAVVTVPASFNDAQRSATATAGAIAGITVARVLNEPTAAALAYGHARQLSRLIAVYDFGGGTFDITVLRLQDQVYEVLGTAGDSFLGGDDLDEVLMQHMADAFLAKHRIDLRDNEIAVMRLRAVAEQTKIELSRRTRAIVKVDEAAYGPGGVPINLEIEIHREELVHKTRPLVDRTFTVCEEALRLAGVQAGQIEDVVLVGGTTKIPAVRERVTQFFQRGPRTDVNAEEAVALGAALQATALDRVLKRRTTSRGPAAVPPAPVPAPITARGPAVSPPSAPTMIATAPTAPITRASGSSPPPTEGPGSLPPPAPPRSLPPVPPPVPPLPGRGKPLVTASAEEQTEVLGGPPSPARDAFAPDDQSTMSFSLPEPTSPGTSIPLAPDSPAPAPTPSWASPATAPRGRARSQPGLAAEPAREPRPSSRPPFALDPALALDTTAEPPPPRARATSPGIDLPPARASSASATTLFEHGGPLPPSPLEAPQLRPMTPPPIPMAPALPPEPPMPSARPTIIAPIAPVAPVAPEPPARRRCRWSSTSPRAAWASARWPASARS